MPEQKLRQPAQGFATFSSVSLLPGQKPVAPIQIAMNWMSLRFILFAISLTYYISQWAVAPFWYLVTLA